MFVKSNYLFLLNARRSPFYKHITVLRIVIFFLELKARCDVQTSTRLYTEAATITTTQTPEISSTVTTQETLS